MARRKEEAYVFDASAGTVKIAGHINQSDLLLIVNTTRGITLYNFNDPAKGATYSHNHDFDEDFPTSIDGTCTFTLEVDTSGMTSTDYRGIKFDSPSPGDGGGGDDLLIMIEDERRGLVVRPFDVGLDAVERIRVSNPESLIDADFEYGIQTTKWETTGTNRNAPAFYETSQAPLAVTDISSEGSPPSGSFSLITITFDGTVSAGEVPAEGGIISVQGTGDFFAEGLFPVEQQLNTPLRVTYRAKGIVPSDEQLLFSYTQVKTGGIYEYAGLNTSSYTTSANSGIVTVTFSDEHCLVPGSPIAVVDSTGGKQDFEGRYYVRQVENGTTINYDSGATPGVTDTPSLNTTSVYVLNDAFVYHKPKDGGVQVGSALAVHGAQCIRQTKRYFRYQSGKGILFATGAVLAPSFNIEKHEIINAGTQFKITTGEAHGMQPGAGIQVENVTASDSSESDIINSWFTIQDVTTKTMTVDAKTAIDVGAGNTSTLTVDSFVGISTWSGSVIRTGMFDDTNGVFWEFNGINLSVVKRSSTFNIAGLVTCTNGSTAVETDTGITNNETYFNDELVAGQIVQIQGMPYLVISVEDNSRMIISPKYRGVTQGAMRCSLVKNTRIPQKNFNFDTLDGKGGSHYNLLLEGRRTRRMQMFGIQYSWYGAGHIDYMVRGPLGDWIVAHRIANNNVNQEAYMRSGNLPARYETINCSVLSPLTAAAGDTDTTLSITAGSSDNFPDPSTYGLDKDGNPYLEYVLLSSFDGGGVLNHEVRSYSGKSGTTLTGVTTATSYTSIVNDTEQRFYGGGTIDSGNLRGLGANVGTLQSYSHPARTAAVLISTTCAPQFTHWGSSVVMDGGFDDDASLLFGYTSGNFTLAAGETKTLLVLRPAPSASNTLSGAMGERELINRSVTDLISCSVVASTAGNNAQSAPGEIIGILNPTSFTTISPDDLTFSSVNSPTITVDTNTSKFFQPSFLQIAVPTESEIPLDGQVLFRFFFTQGANRFELDNVRELITSVFGGDKVYPDGPDTLVVVARNLGNVANQDLDTLSFNFEWLEAQA